MSNRTKIAIADDHKIFAEGIQSVLKDQDWITFIDRCFGSLMNEWEKEFIENIRFSTFPFSEKQSIKIRDIFEKYKALHPDRLERYLN